MQSRSDSISKVNRSGERKNFPQRNTPASTGERRELRLKVTPKGAKYDRYVETKDRNGRALVSATPADHFFQHIDHRSEEHTSELQSHLKLVCRLLLLKKKKKEV